MGRVVAILIAVALAGCAEESAGTNVQACVDANLSGEALSQCNAYCGGDCTPDSQDELCQQSRSRYNQASGLVAFPCDCEAAAAQEAAFLEANPPPAPEPVTRAVLAVPEGVDPDTVADANFHPNGEHLIWRASFIGEEGQHIMISRIDGSDFSCLTCPLGDGLPFAKLDIFSDGRRVVVGNQVTFGQPDPLPYPSPFPGYETVPILECTPSLLDCQTPELVFVRVPFDPDDAALFENQRVREFRIAPDGVHLAWSQARNDFLLGVVPVIGELRREADHYELDNVEVVTPVQPVLRPLPDEEGFEFEATPSSEIKRFIEGGAAIAGASAKKLGLNRDAGRLDVATGETQSLTHHPDYDEPVDVSPDGNWLVVGSKRNPDPAFDVMAAFGLVPRPNFVSIAANQLLGIWAFAGNFGQNRGLDTWLIDRLGARGDYIGQHLSNDFCYGGRERQHWNADGTRVAKGERIRPVMSSDLECEGLPERRLVVYELTSRTPVPPEDRPEIVATPDAPWASAITDPKNQPGVDLGLYVVPGQVFGEARLDVLSEGVSIEYENYSDDGLVVLNGTESFFQEPSISYPADIEVSGCRPGFVRSNVSLEALSGAMSILSPLSGSASSQLGDESYEICEPGLPGVDTCE